MPNRGGTMETARLMRHIGDAVNMDWGCSSSGANTQNEVSSSFVDDFGYSSAVYAGFNLETVKRQLDRNLPVILRGGRKSGWWIFATYTKGHAWVCDGYKRVDYDCSFSSVVYYLHMNWGWTADSEINGWFIHHNWNPGPLTFNDGRGMVYNIKP